jgi:hypothetical protein
MMQYTHRQRGSEAAVPILVFGMKAIGCDEQTATSDRFLARPPRVELAGVSQN